MNLLKKLLKKAAPKAEAALIESRFSCTTPLSGSHYDVRFTGTAEQVLAAEKAYFTACHPAVKQVLR